MTITQKISGRILVQASEYQRATGCEFADAVRWAFDKVLGVGSFEAMASELYDELRAKAA